MITLKHVKTEHDDLSLKDFEQNLTLMDKAEMVALLETNY